MLCCAVLVCCGQECITLREGSGVMVSVRVEGELEPMSVTWCAGARGRLACEDAGVPVLTTHDGFLGLRRMLGFCAVLPL
jgi:hypothetical protein